VSPLVLLTRYFAQSLEIKKIIFFFIKKTSFRNVDNQLKLEPSKRQKAHVLGYDIL
jgi:hypothetical protein